MRTPPLPARRPDETEEQWAQRCDFESMLAKRRAKAEKKAQELAKMERANARRKAKNMKMNEEFDALENAREAKAARRAAKEGIAPKEVKPSGLIKTIKLVKPPPLPDTG